MSCRVSLRIQAKFLTRLHWQAHSDSLFSSARKVADANQLSTALLDKNGKGNIIYIQVVDVPMPYQLVDDGLSPLNLIINSGS